MAGFLKLSEIRADLGVADKTVRRIISRGELPVLRDGAILRVPRDAYDKWKAARIVPARATPEAVPERPVLKLRQIPRPRRQGV
jgi:excisionase family DNA binding protein